MTTTHLIEELLGRSAVYQGMSVLLRDPDADTAKWLAAREHHRLPELIERLHPDSSESLRESTLRLVSALDSASMEEWTREHERIFGHSVQGAAPPYELEYGEAHSHRQPQELGDIAAFYQAFGLQASRAAHERVDSIVAECDFMQYLLYKQACALDEDHEGHAEVCQAAARQFLADHLGRWGPTFCLRLSQAAGSEGVLAAVAEAALAWLAQDCARAGVPAGSRDLPLRLPKEQDDVGCAACALQPTGHADGRS